MTTQPPVQPNTTARSLGLALILGLLLATTSNVATRSTTLTLPAGTTFSASASYPGAGPGNAFDGNPDTLWNAGRHPLVWIEVDFGRPQELSGMHALVSQSPAGNTVHQVSLDGVLAFTWSGYTSDNQTLDHVFATPQVARRVRITTTSSPSWVAWWEITFDGPSTAPPFAAADVYRTSQDTPVAVDVRSGLVGHWTFETGADVRDLTGNFGDLTLQNGASIADGALNLDAGQAAFSGAYAGPALSSKTLVAWLRLDNLEVQTGSPLSLEQVDVQAFDAIVYGERQPHQWMAGSDFFNRTQDFDPGFAETTVGELVQVAITYEDLGGGLVRIRGYRNGIQIGDYTSGNLRVWNPGVIAKFGPRAVSSGSIDAHIDEARIYNRVLSGSDLAALSIVESAPTNNLVGYWNFDDGTARDSSGYNNHGVPTGGAIVGGVLGRGLDLRGGGNVITIPNTASLQTRQFTVAYWAKFAAPHNPVIVSKVTASGVGNAWQANVSSFGSGQNTQFCLMSGQPENDCSYSPILTPDPVGRWMHVAMTYDGTTANTYADGVLVQSVDVIFQPELGNADITLGNHPNDSYDFEGLLDEVRLYDAALSAADVAALAATHGVLLNDVSTSGGPLTAVKMTDPQHGTVALSSDGGFVYAPAAGFAGVDSFIYRAFDGTVTSQDATVTIMVTPVCAAGAYLANPGDVACTPAPAGSYVPKGGATEPIPCPEGFTSVAGATACVPLVQRLAEFTFENVTAENTQWVVGPLSAPASFLHPSFTSGAFGWTDADGYFFNFWEQGVRTWSTNVFLTRGLGPVGAPGLTQLFVDLNPSSAWSLTGFSARLLHNDFPSMPIDVIAVQNGVSTLLGTVVSNCTTYPDCHRSFDLSSAPYAFAAGPVRLVLAPQFNTGSAFVMVDDIRIDGIVAATAPVVQCMAGSFLALPTDTECTPALPGTYVAVEGATEAVACALGKYQPLAGQTACLDAPAGSVVDIMGAADVTLCAAGTYQPLNGQTTCLVAEPGTYVPVEGASEALACAAGFFSATEGATACTAAATSCASGEWIASPASATANISCDVADPGTYATGVETAPIACAEGTYQPLSGQLSCEMAPAGSYVNVTGAEAATLCAAGSFQPLQGQASCTLAPAGSFVDTAGATEAIVCPAGTVSDAGATACTNTAPTLTPVPVSVTASQSFTGTLASVADAETGVAALVVQLVSAPAGVTVTNLVNTGGTITGVIGASCSAVSGPLVLSVADAALVSTSGTVQVTVVPAPAPSIGAYGDVTLNPGESITVTPSSPAGDAAQAPTVLVGGGFTGVATINAAGVVSIVNAGPGGSYPATVTVTGACGAAVTTTFTVEVRTGAQQAAVLRGATVPALIRSGGIARSAAGQILSAARKLEHFVTRGNRRTAEAAVRSFSNEVRAGLNSGRITVEAAQVLLRAAESMLGVPPPNLTPFALKSAVQTTTEDRSKSFNMWGRDPDADDLLSFQIVTAPQHGTVTVGAPRMQNSSSGPYWVAVGTYVPNRDYFGPDTFTFAVFDGLAVSAPVVQAITVTPVNDRPVATPQTLTTEGGATLAITVSGTDVDGDTLTYRVGRPRYGSLTGTAPNLVYTAPKVVRALEDSFSFSVDDGHGGRTSAIVRISVAPVNVAPVCQTSVATISLRNPKPGWLTLKVGDPNGDALTFAWTSVPNYGNVSPITLYRGTYRYYYKPTVSPFRQTDSFTYTATDPSGLSTSCTAVVRGR